MGSLSRYKLLRVPLGDNACASSLLDTNLQRLIARLHEMNFFESFLITSQDVLRDIRDTLGLSKVSRIHKSSDQQAQNHDSRKKEVAKNIFLVTTECRFRCNIYLVNPRPPDKADESAFEVRATSTKEQIDMQTQNLGGEEEWVRCGLYR